MKISTALIKRLFAEHSEPPGCIDDLNIFLLFERLPFHRFHIDDLTTLVIANEPELSPFHRIPLKNIHAIVDNIDSVILVLHASIIAFAKAYPHTFFHLR